MNVLFRRFTLRRFALGACGAALVGLLGCTEDFTTPGSCPQTCPGGNIVIRDTVIDAVVDGDSSYFGYLARARAPGCWSRRAEPADQYLTTMRFGGFPDSIRIGDSLYAFVIDSVAISLGVARAGPERHRHRAPAVPGPGHGRYRGYLRRCGRLLTPGPSSTASWCRIRWTMETCG